ncbi:Hypothetical predicted protein [Lecanosticta acicola]|uniref:C2H2-type domain-containing protein n=1 Tax=Lecanosticta acicola TaxID=111012 RepID=A0AAI8YWU1_9PEZI|nr:Hypothetical predicted protein [Lecanosticta acicola]
MAFARFQMFTLESDRSFQRPYERSCIVDDNFDGSIYNPGSQLGDGGVSTIQRFLLEPHPTFGPPVVPRTDQHMLHTLPGPMPGQLPSPALSTLESSYMSSGLSDEDSMPFSPHPVYSPYSSGCLHNDGFAFAYGGVPSTDRQDSIVGSDCVAMPDVQQWTDDIINNMASDDAIPGYPFAQEGYQPMELEEEHDPDLSHDIPSPTDLPTQDIDAQEPETPMLRRRSAQASRSTAPSSLLNTGSRVAKRSGVGRRSSSYQSGSDANDQKPFGNNRAFPCPFAVYSCSSSFGTKNEWKRHVNTQHLRLTFWRCDQCRSQKPNDFNRKDLFIQHVRRMHSPGNESNFPSKPRRRSSPSVARPATRSGSNADDQVFQEAAKRCNRALRSPPERSCCLFCDEKFRGKGTWDDRMEHIGRHLETAKKEGREAAINPATWNMDEYTHNWLIEQDLLRLDGNEWSLAA